MNQEVWHRVPAEEKWTKPMTLIGVSSDHRGTQGVCINSEGDIVTLGIKHLTTKKEKVNLATYNNLKKHKEMMAGKSQEESQAEVEQRENALAAQAKLAPKKKKKADDDNLEEMSADAFYDEKGSVSYEGPNTGRA